MRVSDKMKFIKADCTNCNKRGEFELIGNNKYRCIYCDNIMHKCKSENCKKMIRHGLFCSRCVGSGFKKGGSLVVGGVVVAVGVAAKFGVKAIKKIR